MSRAFAQPVQLTNAGGTVRDVDNTTDLPAAPATVEGRADIWPLNTQQVVLDGGVVVADYGAIFPPGSPVRTGTEVRDVAAGALYRVHGRPDVRPSLRTGLPDHIGARLKFISDQQGASS